MFEKVNPSHPDKIADRIAGAIVDLAYKKSSSPKIAVEVLVGHKECTVILETSETFNISEVSEIIARITGRDDIGVTFIQSNQDPILAANQEKQVRCGDNGIFRGSPVNDEQEILLDIAKRIYEKYPSDGKYLIDDLGKITVCQSQASKEELKELCPEITVINPLGPWTGGLDVDTGAVNRKLGSDMGDGITGGGIHGKDFTKADTSVNIYLHLLAQQLNIHVHASCSIGDTWIMVYDEMGLLVKEVKFEEVVQTAKEYVDSIGGFEKLAEWGLIR